MSYLKKILRNIPGVNRLDSRLRAHYTKAVAHDEYMKTITHEEFPRGHFYSALPDLAEVEMNAADLFRPDIDVSASINLNEHGQKELLNCFEAFYTDFLWTEEAKGDFRFHLKNDYFAEADALSLYSILRHIKPKRVIEVGSGFSSALMLDTDEKFLGKNIAFTFIDPYPERLYSVLADEDHKRCRIIEDRVQNVSLAEFEALEKDDILFIDSSQVSKIGSDVNYLFFEVLPVLKPGVIVHIHDIFWPFEYPKEWVMGHRTWNEDYLLRAFLQYNSSFEVLLFNSFAGYKFEQYLQKHMPMFLKNTGGSFWMRKDAVTK